MTAKIIHKKSSVPAKVPVANDLDYGELAINYADGKLFYKNTSNSIQELTGGGAGGNSFSTIAVAGQTSVAADSSSDTLTLVAGTNVGITTDASGDSITFAVATVPPRIGTPGTTSGNITPNSATSDQFNILGLTGAITMLAPSGSPVDGQKLLLRIKDDGVGARNITWTTGSSGSYRVIGSVLPTTTTLGKTIYVGCIYNSGDSRWDVIAVALEV